MNKSLQTANLAWKIMKVSIQQLLLCLVLHGACIGNPASGQGILEENVSLEVKDTEMKKVLKLIEKQTSCRFAYSPSSIDVNQKISVSVQQKKLGGLLKELFSPLAVSYKVTENRIVLRSEKKEMGLVTKAEPLPTLSVVVVEPPKIERSISGKVSDETGLALPGVSIQLKGTSQGATTDIDGNFQLNIPDGPSTLIFSYVGYESQEIQITNQSVLDVVLRVDARALSEVVVVGYGSQNRRDVTASIASVKAKDIQGIASTAVDALLQGKAAGVQVVQNSGQPGAEVFVRVRGSASLRADSRPLYVIDGVPMNNTDRTSLDGGGQRLSALADINPADIESMEILKDAAATAIYGARASNGVILITTKRGKEGRARFTFDTYHGMQSVWRKLDLLDGAGFSEILTESVNNRNLIQPNNVNISTPDYQQALAVNSNSTNWQDEVFRTAPISSYNLSVAGGQNNIKTYASLGAFRQQGTIIGQDYERLNGRINIDYQASKRVKIGNSITYSNSNSDRITNDFSGASVLANALLRNPNLPVRNADGSFNIDPLGRNGTENPVQLAEEISFRTTQKRLIANVFAEIKILEGLTFKSIFGIDNIGERTQRFVPNTILFTQGAAQAQALSSETATWLNDNTLNFNRSIGKNHRIAALAGLGFQRSRTDFLQASGNTAGSNIITTLAVATIDIPNNFISEWRLLSYFGRVNYSFKDKYVVEASFRSDGSSRFGENRRYGLFPAASVAWRVSQEAFMENLPIISDLKLRGGVGVTGNQEGLENFGSLTRYGTGRNYDGRPGISQANVPNPNLGWESTTTTNIGLDLGLFDDRLNFTVDAYLKQTEDLLFTRQLPWTAGFSNIPNVNVGSLENQGIELALNARVLDGAFKWTIDFNIAFNRNKITDLPVNGSAGSDLIFKLPDAYSSEGPYSIYRVGQPMGTFYGYQFNGVFANDEQVPANLKDQTGGNAFQNYRGGFPIWTDGDNNGAFDRQFDRFVIGNALPKHTGGFTSTFSYKGLELTAFLNWSFGNQIYNMTRAVLTNMADDFNQSTEVLQRWRKPGDQTNIPLAMYRANSFQGNSITDASSRYVEDGSFLRLRNLTLAYNLPNTLLKNQNLRVYVSGQNLLTITNYQGFDPESQNTGGGLIPTLGVDYLTQPLPRVVMFGLNFGF
jgi:TonB-dependent starch-binding outer membrane protein SusC